MSRSFLVVILCLVPALALFADFKETVAAVDSLNDEGRYLEARSLLLDAVGSASAKEKAELYWRAARETLNLGDAAEEAKQPVASILKVFEEGEGYANKAIEADPDSCQGYYWKSANIGRWGQVKGIFESLAKAAPMRELLIKDLSLNPTHADAYYVLGQLYRELPGWPLSFGNIEWAVSLGRQAVDLRADQVAKGSEKSLVYSFYNELAQTLYKRNWSAAGRVRDQKARLARFDAARDALERGCAYEGTVTLLNVSDREEAKAMMQWAVSELEKKADRTVDDDKDLKGARDLLKGW